MSTQEKEQKNTRLLQINAEISWNCEFKCEDCYRFFDCPHPAKRQVYVRGRAAQIKENLSSVRYKLVISSGKGGVGKSTVTCGLGITLAQQGKKVGIIDCDLAGPSIPRILGLSHEKLKIRGARIVPAVGPVGIKVVSMAFLLGREGSVTWFHGLKREAIETFLAHVDFGVLEYLLIDLPPGTGAETHNVLKFLPDLTGGVVVTIPSELSQEVALRGVNLLKKAGIPVVGVVENMSGIVCPDCGEVFEPFTSGGGLKLAQVAQVPFLGKVFLDEGVSSALTENVPFLQDRINPVVADSFSRIVCRIENNLTGSAGVRHISP